MWEIYIYGWFDAMAQLAQFEQEKCKKKLFAPILGLGLFFKECLE